MGQGENVAFYDRLYVLPESKRWYSPTLIRFSVRKRRGRMEGGRTKGEGGMGIYLFAADAPIT